MEQVSTDQVHLPHDHGGVLGSGGEFGAVVGELAEPNLVTVFGQNLLSVTWELLPERQTQRHTRQEMSPSVRQVSIHFLHALALHGGQ